MTTSTKRYAAGHSDGRVVARKNEIRVLRALRRFGWLRTRDLAALVWQRWSARAPASDPRLGPPIATAAGLRMAQRTLGRLWEKHQVLRGRGPDGSVIYTLAEAGARTLQQFGIAAVSGKDLMRRFSIGHYRHRCISTEIAIGAITRGFRVCTEREIFQGLWLGGQQGFGGKRPDVLVRSDSAFWLIEVQRSRMNAKDYARLLQWLDVARRNSFRFSDTVPAFDRLAFAKVVYICTPAFREKLCRDLKATGWSEDHIVLYLRWETSLYKFEDIIFS